jgi:hypothetical protein
MNITNYIIDICNTSLEDRLKLKQVLLDNGQIIYNNSVIFTECTKHFTSVIYSSNNLWAGSVSEHNISLKEFISKFGKPLLHQHWKDLYNQGIELEIKHCLDSDYHWSVFDSDCGLSTSFNEPNYEYRIKPQAKYELDMAQQTPLGWYVAESNSDSRLYLRKNLIVQEYVGAGVTNSGYWPTEAEANQARAKYLGEQMEPEIKIGSHWERINNYTTHKPAGQIVQITNIFINGDVQFGANELSKIKFLERFKPRPDLDSQEQTTNPFQIGDRIRSVSEDNPKDRPYFKEFTVQAIDRDDVYYKQGFAAHYSKFELVSRQTTVHNHVEPINQPNQIKEQPMNNTTLKLLLALMGATTEAAKDATNSNFIGIITNSDDEYIGYVYADTAKELKEIIAKPSNEGNTIHTFKFADSYKQATRPVIKVARAAPIAEDADA